MFGTKGIVEGGLYITPGIHTVLIGEVTSGSTDNGKDYIEIVFYKKGTQPDSGRGFRFFMSSEGAIKASGRKITHIGTKLMTREELDAISGENLTTYAVNLNAAFNGKELRMVFDAEEYMKNGEKRLAAKLNRLGDFAEATVEGAEYPAISDDDTKLTYTEDNIKRMANIDADMDTPEMPIDNTLEY